MCCALTKPVPFTLDKANSESERSQAASAQSHLGLSEERGLFPANLRV